MSIAWLKYAHHDVNTNREYFDIIFFTFKSLQAAGVHKRCTFCCASTQERCYPENEWSHVVTQALCRNWNAYTQAVSSTTASENCMKPWTICQETQLF